MSTTTRIAKNTLALYFRQIFIMLVSLYTVRVVLATLGAEDYGIYQVASGVVAMIGFLSAPLISALDRYFAIEIGRNDFIQLKRIFNLNCEIYLMLAVIIIILGETIGLWFVKNKLILPEGRKGAALWVYHTSIISFLFTMLSAPCTAMLIAHEKMDIFAGISIIESFLKLGNAFLIKFIVWDKLQLYGVLLCISTFVTSFIYWGICLLKYDECKFKFYWNKRLLIEIASFNGWHLFSVFSLVVKNHLINILLNQFFTPIVSAARAISLSISNAVSAFVQNFYSAIAPQIFKSYAKEEKERVFKLAFFGSKMAYLLIYIFVLPLIFEMPVVLSLWLGNPPEYTIIFSRLSLIAILPMTTTNLLGTIITATGKIKLFHFLTGCIELLNFPASLILIICGLPVYSVMIVAACVSCLTSFVWIFLLQQLIPFSVRFYLKKVIIPVGVITVLSPVLPSIFHNILHEGIFRLLIVTITSTLSVSGYSYLIALDIYERGQLKSMIRGYIRKFKEKTR